VQPRGTQTRFGRRLSEAQSAPSAPAHCVGSPFVCFEVEADADWGVFMRILQPFALRQAVLRQMNGEITAAGRLSLRIEIDAPSPADAD
jgi:hypothetical protein